MLGKLYILTNNDAWKMHWFIVNNEKGVLNYFESSDCLTQLGSIPIGIDDRTEVLLRGKRRMSLPTSFAFMLKLNDGKVYELCAETAADLKSWVMAISAYTQMAAPTQDATKTLNLTTESLPRHCGRSKYQVLFFVVLSFHVIPQ